MHCIIFHIFAFILQNHSELELFLQVQTRRPAFTRSSCFFNGFWTVPAPSSHRGHFPFLSPDLSRALREALAVPTSSTQCQWRLRNQLESPGWKPLEKFVEALHKWGQFCDNEAGFWTHPPNNDDLPFLKKVSQESPNKDKKLKG